METLKATYEKFTFGLGEPVRIKCSGEQGEVIGRAEYSNGAEDGYYLRYMAADGRAVTAWWDESAIESAVANIDDPADLEKYVNPGMHSD